MAIITQSANRNISDIEFFDVYDIYDEGFIESDINTRKILKTFSFWSDTKVSINQNPIQEKTEDKLTIQNKPYASSPNKK